MLPFLLAYVFAFNVEQADLALLDLSQSRASRADVNTLKNQRLCLLQVTERGPRVTQKSTACWWPAPSTRRSSSRPIYPGRWPPQPPRTCN